MSKAAATLAAIVCIAMIGCAPAAKRTGVVYTDDTRPVDVASLTSDQLLIAYAYPSHGQTGLSWIVSSDAPNQQSVEARTISDLQTTLNAETAQRAVRLSSLKMDFDHSDWPEPTALCRRLRDAGYGGKLLIAGVLSREAYSIGSSAGQMHVRLECWDVGQVRQIFDQAESVERKTPLVWTNHYLASDGNLTEAGCADLQSAIVTLVRELKATIDASACLAAGWKAPTLR